MKRRERPRRPAAVLPLILPMCLLLITGIMSEDLQLAALTVSLAEFEKWSRPRCPPIIFPHLDCSEFSSRDAVWNFVDSGVASIQLTYPAINDQLNFMQKFLSRVCPSDQYTSEVTETLAKQLHVGLVCGKLWTEPPATLASFIKRFWREVYPKYRTRFRSIDPNCTEVFLFHHGLWRLPGRLKRRLRTKAILDVGAYNGDSALVLSQYAKDVYSIELSAKNVQTIKRVLADNPRCCPNVHVVHAGVAARSGRTSVLDVGGTDLSLQSQNGTGTTVRLVTIDDFVEEREIALGFVKADVEGFGYELVKRAIKTFRRDRPIFSISSYHNMDEMYTMSEFLVSNLPHYHFEWHMENDIAHAWFELSFFGYPID
jgi:FkbM family methyltransferase